jgi:hypothetical protein
MIRSQRVRPLVVLALLALAVIAAFAGIVLIPVWVQPPLSQANLAGVASAQERVVLQQAQAQLQNSIRVTLLQGLAGLLVVAGAVTTWRQVQISREGQITDRLSHAIDQVGDSKVDIRVGGMYALERLARDSAADRAAIAEILAAFIRTHASWPAGHRSHPDPHPTPSVDETMLWLTDRAPDVRTAVLVLGRYPSYNRAYRLAVRRVDLRRTNFYHGTLINVDIRDSNLAGCYAAGVHWVMCRFRNTDLRKTRMPGAVLNESDFRDGHLQEVDLEGATLRNASFLRASLRGANLRNADLSDSDLSEADLRGADLSGARLAGAKLINVVADQATVWPPGFSP